MIEILVLIMNDKHLLEVLIKTININITYTNA